MFVSLNLFSSQMGKQQRKQPVYEFVFPVKVKCINYDAFPLIPTVYLSLLASPIDLDIQFMLKMAWVISKANLDIELRRGNV